MLADEVMAAALVDRLVHHCHIVNIRGNSYRLRQHADLARRLHGAGAGAPLPATQLDPSRRGTDRTNGDTSEVAGAL